MKGRRRILVASTNPGKMAELRAMLDADVEWVGLSDFPGLPEVEEDGATFAENARKKAVGYARATGLWTIADDSGNAQAEFIAHRFGGFKHIDAIRITDDLHQTFPVAQVDEDDATMVAPAMHPAAQADGLAEQRFRGEAAVMCSH